MTLPSRHREIPLGSPIRTLGLGAARVVGALATLVAGCKSKAGSINISCDAM